MPNNIAELNLPKCQMNLYGYSHFFNLFTNLYKKNKLPNSLLISGSKGVGKSTFIYHFVNYILSINEPKKYSVTNFKIEIENPSFNLLQTNTHPNFFLVENVSSDKQIKVDQIRKLINFLNKSTYSQDLKIVMIDNTEYLNSNSSNSLLKVIEEPNKNTYFFIIHNNAFKLLNTIKSRCTEFKISFNRAEKSIILDKIFKQYNLSHDNKLFTNEFYFDTPGNIIKYLNILKNSHSSLSNDTISCIFYFMDFYLKNKNLENLSILSLFIDKFYNELYLSKNSYSYLYFYNHYKILRLINSIKIFNVSEKNIFITIKDLLKNDQR